MKPWEIIHKNASFIGLSHGNKYIQFEIAVISMEEYANQQIGAPQKENEDLKKKADELAEVITKLNESIDRYWNADVKSDVLIKNINEMQQKCFKALSNYSENK